jgi:hypothetical protein
MATFTETFEPYLRAGKDVLYLGFSSGLSGTYNNSVLVARELAEKYPEQKIYAVDTLCAAFGEGLLVWHAVQKKREGGSIDEVKEWTEQNRCRLHHWFTVDDLNHLKTRRPNFRRGGADGDYAGYQACPSCGRRRPSYSDRQSARTQAGSGGYGEAHGADERKCKRPDGFLSATAILRKGPSM